MKRINLGTTIKWQETDERDVPDVRSMIVDNIQFPPGLILEIGCAAGNFYNFLAVTSRFNNHYVGVDLDLKQIKKAKKRFPTAYFIHGNILHMDELLKDCMTIVSFQVLEHIEKDLEMFEEIETGKNMIFSVPNFPYRTNQEGGHKRHYNLKGWVKRYEEFIDFSEVWTIKHYHKNRKIFVFQGVMR